MAEFNGDVRKGDTYKKVATYRNKKTQVPINITGATVTGKIVDKNGAITTLTCAITDAVNGKFEFGLSAAQTAALVTGKYSWELKITFADNTVKTFFTGQFVVTA